MLNTEVNFNIEDVPDDGKALSMVNYDPSLGQFIINPDALEVIRQLQMFHAIGSLMVLLLEKLQILL